MQYKKETTKKREAVWLFAGGPMQELMAKKIKAARPETKIIFLTNVKDVDYIGEDIKSSGYDCLIKADIHVEDILKKAKNKLGV